MFDEKTFTAVTEMAVKIGVPGACLIILTLAIGWHLPKILESFRGMLRDYREDVRKSRELSHRIARDCAIIGSELAQKKAKLKLPAPEGTPKK